MTIFLRCVVLQLIVAAITLARGIVEESFHGDEHLRQQLKLARQQSPSSILLLTDMRYDGAGAEIREMILYAAYTARRKWKYIGAVKHPIFAEERTQHQQNVPELADFIFGRPVAFPFVQAQSLERFNNSDTLRVVEAVYAQKKHGKTGEQVLPTCIVIDSLDDIRTNQLMRTQNATIVWIRQTNSIEYMRLCDVQDVPYRTIPLTSDYDVDVDTSLGSTILADKYTAVDLRFFDKNSSKSLKQRSITVLDNVLTEAFTNEMRGLILHNAAKAAVEGSDHVQLLFAPHRLSVAVHLRRGRDVSTTKHTERYTPDEYYYNLVARIRLVHPDADVHVFSSLENHTKPSSFDGFRARGMQVHFEDTVGVKQAWINMMEARILITAKSSFSFVPALLNPHCVIFEAVGNLLHFGKMRSWITEIDMTEEYLRSCKPT